MLPVLVEGDFNNIIEYVYYKDNFPLFPVPPDPLTPFEKLCGE